MNEFTGSGLLRCRTADLSRHFGGWGAARRDGSWSSHGRPGELVASSARAAGAALSTLPSLARIGAGTEAIAVRHWFADCLWRAS